jgi:hypothetical protein
MGQYSLADEVVSKIGVKTSPSEQPLDRDLEKRHFHNLDFLGAASVAFPELGKSSPRVFRGIRAERYESIRMHSRVERSLSSTAHSEEKLSIGDDDTCLAIEV